MIFEWNFIWVSYENFQFNLILVIDDCCVSCEIPIRWVSLVLTDYKSTLIQVINCCRWATRHYLSQCWHRSMLPYGITRSHHNELLISLTTFDYLQYKYFGNVSISACVWLNECIGPNSWFLACSRACASKVFSLRADCGRVIVYPGLKQWERPRHNIFGVCTRLAGGVCMSTSANSSASKHLTVTKIVWKIVYVTFDYLISHFFKILSLEFMANLFRDFRASVSLKVFHYRLRGKWCQYDLEIN